MNFPRFNLRRFLSGFGPQDLAPYEIFFMRALFAIVAAMAIPGNLPYSDQPHPVGLARLMDFTWMADGAKLEIVRTIYWCALGAFALGAFPALTMTVAALIFNAAGALMNSQGADKHHLQIIGLILLVLAIHYVVQAIRKPGKMLYPSHETGSRGMFYAQQTIVATYLVTGFYKIARSGIGWISDAQYFPLQLEKSTRMDYYNSLTDEAIVGMEQVIGSFLLEHPNLSRIFIGTGLLVEIGALLLLAGRWWGVGYGLLLIIFHLTISEVMHLTFQYNIFVIAIFFVNVPWLLTRLRPRAL